ncbi:hypothetical protein SAMN05421770_101149 [Granulicella rosea]|uniref:Uncharacterized protein n=1 Tax=Granulicella rosea TaxID=474952 RepID=A0A239CVQ2_9BACT|nr:hypothetical protein [Granulicella rosea]SNS24326.1 hypothetical protein SAMN05421770_101149 [Granulicella rosea]
MNKSLRIASVAASLAVLPLTGQAQTAKPPAKTRAHAKKKAAPSVETQIRQLREELQGEIDQLKSALAAKDEQISSLQVAVLSADRKASAAATHVDTVDATLQQNVVVENDLKNSVGDLQVKSVAVTASVQEVKASEKTLEKAINEPLSLHYKGITLTPGGFVAGESIWRQRAMNADIYTNFNATPYMNSGEAKTSEWVPSARATRPNILLSGKVPFGTINAFVEGDFLSAGITSNNLQTNSYTLRLRQAWAQAVVGKIKFTGGQMWTLATENRKATDNNTEQWPLVPDQNAHVGFSYLRQVGFRLQDAITPRLTLAVALEASQYQFAATNAPLNFFFGAPGALPGLESNQANLTNQVAPDIIVKAAWDPKFGHYELGGIGRFFRDRYYPNYPTNSLNAANDTRFGGGFIANARFPVAPKLDLGLHLIAGDGTGRYGASLLPDITVRPNGTLAPLRNAQGMFSLEAHPSKRLDLFAYAGTEYVQREYKVGAAGVLVGYAPPTASNAACNTEALPTAGTGYAPGVSTCTGATRALIEGSAGWVFRLYSGPAGKLQYGAAYSYLTREAWTGVGGAPKATNNMVYTSFRYYLP